MAAAVKAVGRRPGLSIQSGRGSWPQGPRTSRTQHACGLRRPRSAEQGGCAEEQAPAGPDTCSFPNSAAIQEQRSPPMERSVRHGSERGRVVGRFLLLRGSGPHPNESIRDFKCDLKAGGRNRSCRGPCTAGCLRISAQSCLDQIHPKRDRIQHESMPLVLTGRQRFTAQKPAGRRPAHEQARQKAKPQGLLSSAAPRVAWERLLAVKRNAWGGTFRDGTPDVEPPESNGG
jgi:hypothetical protein